MAKIKPLSRLMNALYTAPAETGSGMSKEAARSRRSSSASGDSRFEALSERSLGKRVRNAVSRSPEPSADAYDDFVRGARFGKPLQTAKRTTKTTAKPPQTPAEPALATTAAFSQMSPVRALPDMVKNPMRLPAYMQETLPAPFPKGPEARDSNVGASPAPGTEVPPKRRRASEPGSDISSD
jgi:hypothetical protein